jgi:hypothetical protein
MTGFGVVASLVDPRLAPGFENLYFIRIILAGDRFGCGHFGWVYIAHPSARHHD